MSRRSTRIPRSREDLMRELSDQRALLQLSCEAYDAGSTVAGKPIAVTLRLLLHSGKGRTRALLDHLGLRSGRFLSSIPPITAGNLLSDSPLVLIELGDAGARYRPLCAAGNPPVPPHWPGAGVHSADRIRGAAYAG